MLSLQLPTAVVGSSNMIHNFKKMHSEPELRVYLSFISANLPQPETLGISPSAYN